MITCRIVTDSSSDLLELDSGAFAAAPLKIVTADKEYVDDASLDVKAMVEDLLAYKGRSSTSCPNADEWFEAFGNAPCVLCITITGTLSGAYNAACAAKSLYEDMYPDRRVFVLNSLTTGPEMRLLLEEADRLRQTATSFDELCASIEAYTARTGLLFVLESMRNLANNGRVHPLVAKAAGLFGIRVVGRAGQKGDLETLSKCRGADRALEYAVEYLKTLPHAVRKVRIAHCMNEDAAQSLKASLQAVLPAADILVYPCRGLCSFYAEKGGFLIGYETEA